MNKTFVLDTNVLIENPECILKLRNGEENRVCIPYNVLIELDKLKKEPRLSHIVSKIVDNIWDHYEYITFGSPRDEKNIDHYIMTETDLFKGENKILITNDKILRLLCRIRGIAAEELKDSLPFTSESEIYTGIIDTINNPPSNSFTMDGETFQIYCNKQGWIDVPEHNIWKVIPRDYTQNLAFELLLNDEIPLVSIQSAAGFGKTFLSLATAFHKVFQEKNYNKIYIFRPMIEIGEGLGYRKGDLDQKIAPFANPIFDLMEKLCDLKYPSKLFTGKKGQEPEINKKRFEICPINFTRGANLENAFVIIDECQNLSRLHVRTLLTRMGQNVKCVCVGDTNQIDNQYLNKENNGLNWIVKLFRGQEKYGHIVLSGEKSRGPICDMSLKVEL